MSLKKKTSQIKNAKKQANRKGGQRREKKTPSNTEQWASDAYNALEKALIAFEQEYPNPTDEEQLELVGFAADIAANARGITDEKRIDEADEYAVDHILADIDEDDDGLEGEPETPPQYNLLFLICYLDVHIAFGLLKEEQLGNIMDYLVENYDLITD